MLLTKRQILLLALLSLFWGVNWPIMKLALGQVTPLYYRTITMAGGAFILACWLTIYKGRSLKLNKSDSIKIALLTIPNMIFWHVFSIYGVSELASGRASVLGFTMPIWTVLLSAFILKLRMTFRLWLSVIIVAIALCLLSYHEWSHMSGKPIGIIWMQIAAVSWALGIVLFKKISLSTPPEVTAIWMLILAAIALGFMALWQEAVPDFQSYNAKTWFAIFYGLFINFVIAQIIWFYLLHQLPPSASAFSVMSVPIMSLFSGALIMHEIPQLTDYIAAALIVIAIANTVFVKKTIEVKPNT